jgi:hypothetical protein
LPDELPEAEEEDDEPEEDEPEEDLPEEPEEPEEPPLSAMAGALPSASNKEAVVATKAVRRVFMVWFL